MDTQVLSRIALLSSNSLMTIEIKKKKCELAKCGVVYTNITISSGNSSKHDLKHINTNYKLQKIDKLYAVDDVWRTKKCNKIRK